MPNSDTYGVASKSVAPQLDRQMTSLGKLAIDALELQAGSSIIDVGCGAGQTCSQLAKVVRQDGYVLGIDISPELVRHSKARTQQLPNVDIELGDVQTYKFQPRRFDRIFSRFGVMAFSDPKTAFQNLRSALKSDGRMAFVCWRKFGENEIDHLPFRAAHSFLPSDTTNNIYDSSPFSFANPNTVTTLLEEAGFQSIEISSHDQPVSAGNVDDTLELCLKVGMLGRIVRESPQLRASVEVPLRRALEAVTIGNDVVMNAAVWLVTAKNSYSQGA
ncbi:MAG: class I SAM-dependent methyltransferase [Pseudomonadota bacterium]